MVRLLAGIFLGWTLGSNDTAKTFGAAVSAKMISYRTAALLSAVFIVLGALIDGGRGLETLGSLTAQTYHSAFIVALSAALAIATLTMVRLPVSASHAVVGGITGIGFLYGHIDWAVLEKVILCWILTPVGGILIGGLSFIIFSRIFYHLNLHFLEYDRLMRRLLLAAGCYGAYAIGANNVANVTGVFLKAGMVDMLQATLIGGVSIALGSLSFSRGVMKTLSSRLFLLDASSAFILILSEGITIHLFALIGVPVSITQAAIGAILGIGLVKNFKIIHRSTLYQVLVGWILTPSLSFLFSFLLYQWF
jgi:PiT family inorganic phosphate transporter